ncbi:Hypothetical protein DEACI_2889 [Acididesulfobacillus acetoxydans]|uniref:Uncharacterized protein n=1 Tax=Acididesulfobacillus acetoxydans TaxID=1561005 RepID=A0A8S0XCA0_9FIRM|nr:Hypothetical protein DEACI_2889 [Acididesulfobacillus acetoxydans]CEJ07566.1 Hypothetical protein DEACI_2032 [Acididesulfobacillus acetoxydans]
MMKTVFVRVRTGDGVEESPAEHNEPPQSMTNPRRMRNAFAGVPFFLMTKRRYLRTPDGVRGICDGICEPSSGQVTSRVRAEGRKAHLRSMYIFFKKEKHMGW